MGEAVLVFPAGAPESLAYRDRARAKGLRVVGASSVAHDPAEGAYEAWERLPDVADPGFDEALAEIVERQGVAAIHTPHFLVWRHLAERLGRIAPGTELTGADGAGDCAPLLARVAVARPPAFWPALPPKPQLTPTERAGLVRLVETIPGDCGEAEMHATAEALRHAPSGDVVELGAGSGRTSALLALLARRFQIGSLLCVGDWPDGAEPFEINLSPLAHGAMGVYRGAPGAAAAWYAPDVTCSAPAFGEVRFTGAIAMLRIALADACAAWSAHVMPGGWLVFAEAAKAAAEPFKQANATRIAASFHAGDAAFVQLKRCQG